MSSVRPIVEGERAAPASTSLLLAYLRLFRLPNVFTAMADVLMGFLLTNRSWDPWQALLLLVAASAQIYTAGMVLNDVWDIEIDRAERPSRPLPSGRIAWNWARWLGFQLLAGGMACGWLAGLTADGRFGPGWRSGLIATVLSATVVAYDRWAKRTPLGPVVMGLCRFLNVLLGMSVTALPVVGEWSFVEFGSSHLMIAGGIGVYIVGVTVFARSEATVSPRTTLSVGVAMMIAGIAILALFPRFHPNAFTYRFEPFTTWPLAMAMISIWIVRRAVLAIRHPQPRVVQVAVKHCILSLIVLDAMLCSLTCQWHYGVGIVLLIVPSLILGRWVYST